MLNVETTLVGASGARDVSTKFSDGKKIECILAKFDDLDCKESKRPYLPTSVLR